MVYKKSKKGAQGIGTLIIFIAMILVAAVAAFVLINTASKLQGKAENTGDQIQQRLGTGFTVVEVLARNTNNSAINATTDFFDVTVKLAPGSDPIKAGDITISLVTKDGASSYQFADAISSVTTFNVTYLKNATVDGYISGDDVATFRFNSNFDILVNEKFTIRLFPGAGSPQPIALLTPPAMLDVVTVLK